MDKYDLLQQIGDGTFGSVMKAVHKKSGQLVAIKRMKQKYYSWEECVNLPEVQVLRKLHAHPNVIKLREVVRENNELFFVFEFMDGDLLGVIRKCKQNFPPSALLTSPPVPYPKIKAYMYQLLQSLAFLHKSGYFHRDLKPENLLIRRDPSSPQEVVKLADFGLVKEIRARPPYTDYVSTRWYRAPELLLQDRSYTCSVDVWAAGCIFAELITTKPLFPGTNEVDQLFKIMTVFGSPTEATWSDGMQLARKIRYQFPSMTGTPLRAVLPQHVPQVAVDLLSKMLVYDPKKRITAQQALTHPYFNVGLDEDPLVALPSNAARAVGGAQSAPTTQAQQQMHTPVQWRHAADQMKDVVGANSANRALPSVAGGGGAVGGQSGALQGALMGPTANRPASGNRPMFPPVEISKHTITNRTEEGSATDASKFGHPSKAHESSAGDSIPNHLSKYFLVPTGVSPKIRDPSPSVAPSGGGQPHGFGDSPLGRPPVKLQLDPLEKSAGPSSPVPPPAAASKVTPAHALNPVSVKKAVPKSVSNAVDLDSLMDEFQKELSAMGFQTQKAAVGDATLTRSDSTRHDEALRDDAENAAMFPSQKSGQPFPPRAVMPGKGMPVGGGQIGGVSQLQQRGTISSTATVGVKGLPSSGPSSGSAIGSASPSPNPNPYTIGKDRASPLQKLMLNTRYRPAAASPIPLEGSFGPSSHLSQPPLAPMPARPAPLQAQTLLSPTLANTKSATRYDLDSNSCGSMDIASSTTKGSAPKVVSGAVAVSPTVHTLLSSQGAKIGQKLSSPSPTQQQHQHHDSGLADDDDLPAWLRLVNERTGNKPTAAPVPRR